MLLCHLMEFPDKWWYSTIHFPDRYSRQIGEIGWLSMSQTTWKTMGTTWWGPIQYSTSIHWHGIILEHNGANDGVPGITQCTNSSKLKLMSGPIPPGHSFTYRFRATRYGTTWYHSHFSLQYSEGLLGPFIINGPTIENWDIDLGTVLLQDWYHTPVFQVWFTELQHPPVPADTGLINGKNKNRSIGEYSEFVFIPGKKHRLRVINTSTDGHFKFSIDHHTMTVQAADFVAIRTYTQTVLKCCYW